MDTSCFIIKNNYDLIWILIGKDFGKVEVVLLFVKFGSFNVDCER